MKTPIMMDFFEKADKEFLRARGGFAKIIAILNKISEDPFQDVEVPKDIVDFIPIRWDVNQIYLLIESLYHHKLFQDFCFLIIDGKFKIKDAFILKAEPQENINQIRQKTPVSFALHFFEDAPETTTFFSTLEQLISQEKPIKDHMDRFIKGNYGIQAIQTLIVPWNFKEMSKNLQLPSLNTDLMEFISSFIDLKSFISDTMDKSKSKFLLSQFDQNNLIIKTLTKALKGWENVDLDKWSKIWIAMLDDMMMNVVIADSDYIVLAFKIIVEEQKFSINSLPMSLFKNCCGDRLSKQEIAERISKRTGLRTVVIDEKDINTFFEQYVEEKGDLFDELAKMIEIVYSSPWHPDNLLNSFLKLFDLELGEGIKDVHLALRAVVKYYQNILIATFQSPSDNSVGGTLVNLWVKDRKYNMKLVNSNPYKKIFQDKTLTSFEKLQKLRELLENTLKIKFNVCFGFDIDVLSDSISTKNMQAMLGVNKMTAQLPLLASIGGLFASLKALGVEEEIYDKEQPLVKLHKKESSKQAPTENEAYAEEKMKFVNYFDGFLKKGILCIVDEGFNNINEIRSPIYSKEGYLGLDLKKLRELFTE
jgi:hypothetical protein